MSGKNMFAAFALTNGGFIVHHERTGLGTTILATESKEKLFQEFVRWFGDHVRTDVAVELLNAAGQIDLDKMEKPADD